MPIVLAICMSQRFVHLGNQTTARDGSSFIAVTLDYRYKVIRCLCVTMIDKNVNMIEVSLNMQ